MNKWVFQIILFLAAGSIAGCAGHNISQSAVKQARMHYERGCSSRYQFGIYPPWLKGNDDEPEHISELKKAVFLDPDNADYHYVLAEHTNSSAEYNIAARLNPRYKAALLYKEALGNKSRITNPFAENLLKQAIKYDPANAQLDYELAYLCVQSGRLEEAYKYIKSGNRKPEVRIYLSPVFTDPRLKATLVARAAITFPQLAQINPTSRELCSLEKLTYTLATGGPVHPPAKGNEGCISKCSLVQSAINAGHPERALEICREVEKMTLKTAELKPAQFMIVPFVARASYIKTLQSEVNCLWMLGKHDKVINIQKHYNAYGQTMARIVRQNSKQLDILERPGWKWVLFRYALADGIVYSSSTPGKLDILAAKLKSWSFWIGIPLLIISPFGILIWLSGMVLLRRIKKGSFGTSEAGLCVLLLFALISFGWLSYSAYEGWNPVGQWVEAKCNSELIASETSVTTKITSVLYQFK